MGLRPRARFARAWELRYDVFHISLTVLLELILAISSSNSLVRCVIIRFLYKNEGKPIRTFVSGHQEQQRGPEYFPL